MLLANHAQPWITEKNKMKYSDDDPRFAMVKKLRGESKFFHCHGNQTSEYDPRIHFVLSYHNRFSPSLRLITPDEIDNCLKTATCEYMAQFVSVSTLKRQVRTFIEISGRFLRLSSRWCCQRYLSGIDRILDLQRKHFGGFYRLWVEALKKNSKLYLKTKTMLLLLSTNTIGLLLLCLLDSFCNKMINTN